MSEDLLKRCDNSLILDDSQNRSEFIGRAVEFYIAWLNTAASNKVLAPMVESVVSSTVKDTENRLARVIFKLSVEIAMLVHITAVNTGIQSSEVDKLREMCETQVAKLSGKYSFKDIVDFQNSGA